MARNNLSPPGILLALLMAFSLAGIWCVGYEANHLREKHMSLAQRAAEMQQCRDFVAAAVLWEKSIDEGFDRSAALGKDLPVHTKRLVLPRGHEGIRCDKAC